MFPQMIIAFICALVLLASACLCIGYKCANVVSAGFIPGKKNSTNKISHQYSTTEKEGKSAGAPMCKYINLFYRPVLAKISRRGKNHGKFIGTLFLNSRDLFYLCYASCCRTLS